MWRQNLMKYENNESIKKIESEYKETIKNKELAR